MNKKIINEVNQIKKMMGLISESVTFKNTSDWGINKQNANQFIQKATQNRNQAFMFNNVLYQLKSIGENNPNSISFENENMVFDIGILTYGGKNGFPYIALPGLYDVKLETFPGSNKTVKVVSQYSTPDQLRQAINNDIKNLDLKRAQNAYNNNIQKVSDTLKNEINSVFGQNLSRLKLS